jgi:hypothetical protein
MPSAVTPQSLSDEAPLTLGDLQDAMRLPARDTFRRIKAGEIFTDDFFGTVAFNQLTIVPCGSST